MTEGAFRKTPAPLRVVSDEGPRGGVVEIPIAVPSLVNLAATSGKGNGTLDVNAETFRQILGNFPKRQGPVPAYFGHVPKDQRSATPAAGFVQGVFLEGGALWARVDLGPHAFDAVVRQRGFRAASMEFAHSPASPVAQLSGWTLTGLAITNAPALDVEYAAEAADPEPSHQDADDAARRVRLTMPLLFGAAQIEEQAMEQELKTSLAAFEGRIAALEAAGKQQSAALDASEKARKAAEERVVALEARDKARDDAARKAEGARIVGIVEAAVKDGRAESREFEGVEKDAVAWLEASPYKSADALDKALSLRVAKAAPKGTSSGAPAKAEKTFELSAAQRSELASAGLNPDEVAKAAAAELAALEA